MEILLYQIKQNLFTFTKFGYQTVFLLLFQTISCIETFFTSNMFCNLITLYTIFLKLYGIQHNVSFLLAESFNKSSLLFFIFYNILHTLFKLNLDKLHKLMNKYVIEILLNYD